MFNRITDKLKPLNLWHFVWIGIAASGILTFIIVSVMSIMFQGKITYDYLITGAITALLAAAFIISLIIYFVLQLRENEKSLQAATAKADSERIKSHAIIESIGDAISIQGADFKILYQNKAHKDLTGEHAGEYCYKGYNSRETVCEDCPVAMSINDGMSHKIEKKGASGAKASHIEISAFPIKDDNGKITGIVELVRDISKRRQMEEELQKHRDHLEDMVKEQTANLAVANEFFMLELEERKKSEMEIRDSANKLRTIINSSNDIVLLKDKNLRYVVVNEQCAAFHNKHAKDLIDKTDFDLMPKEAAETCKKSDEAALASEVAIETEEVVDGKWFHVVKQRVIDSEGNTSGLVGVIRDITERKRAEEALRESESYFRGIASAATDAIIHLDNDGKIVFWNRAAEKIFGYNYREVLGKRLHAFIAPDRFSEAYNKGFSRFIETGQGTAVGSINEFTAIKKDGTEFPVEVSVSPIQVKGTWHAIGIIRDITERKKMEEELLKAQKLESIGILAGGIAHDFNNALTGIIGNISLAKMFSQPEEKVFKRLASAEKAALRAQKLTQQLLTFSTGGEPIKKIVSIAGLLEECVNFALRGSNIKCEYSIAQELMPAEVDEGQISQVISNLIINAQHAMPLGGLLNVSAENMNVEHNNAMQLTEGPYIKISVKDHGHGIPDEYISKIFDPYFTTKQEGKGLGLATVYSIIKKHNGHITVESKPQAETVFYIYLPASDNKPLIQDIKDKHICGSGRVLIMDDESDIRHSTSEILESLGYETATAEDGSRAIETYLKAKEEGKPFDAIIMDLTIPGGMGGVETIRRLSEIDPDVRAIVSSGYSTDPVMSDFKKYGFRNFVVKPFSVEDLSKAVHGVIKEQS